MILLFISMNKNFYQEKNKRKFENKIVLLYKQGLTTREISKIVNKSHSWVALIVKKNLPVDKSY